MCTILSCPRVGRDNAGATERRYVNARERAKRVHKDSAKRWVFSLSMTRSLKYLESWRALGPFLGPFLGLDEFPFLIISPLG